MMTDAQRQLYIRRWSALCRAAGWRMSRGRLLAGPPAGQCLPELRALWDAAEQHASQHHRATTLEDLRHGSHFAAFGKFKSSKEFTNDQFSAWLQLVDVLIRPEHLSGHIQAADPERAFREDLVRWVQRVGREEWVLKIARSMFADRLRGDFWEDLPIEDLKVLKGKLGRAERKAREGEAVLATP